MTTESLVSIIMNAHNADQYLRESIDSALTQTYKNLEIIFWDNASTDNTASILLSYADKRIKYYKSNTFTSLGEARNQALSKATGEFIAFLDCDDTWHPQKLEMQIPLFSDKKIGIVYSDVVYFNETYQKKLFLNKKPYRGMCFNELLTDYICALVTVVIRASSLNNVDYWFDVRFSHIEEYDLFSRIGRVWMIDYVDRPLAGRRIHSNSLTWSQPQEFISEKKIFLSEIKNTLNDNKKNNALFNKIKFLTIYEETIILWREGKNIEARTSLLQMDHKCLKKYILYIASFFPFKFIDRLKSKRTIKI